MSNDGVFEREMAGDCAVEFIEGAARSGCTTFSMEGLRAPDFEPRR